MARSGSSASPSDAITRLIAARDSLLVFERGSRDTEGTGVSGTNSTAPQGAGVGLVYVRSSGRTELASDQSTACLR